ncbi:hypothetical protein [Heliobacterium mobile]|nr:hypothetical protein [Heliobacterium mobile]
MLPREETVLQQELLMMPIEDLKAEAARLREEYAATKDMETQVRLSVAMAALYYRDRQSEYEKERKLAETFAKVKGTSGKTWFVPPKSETHRTRVYYIGRSGKMNSTSIDEMRNDLGGTWMSP